MKQSKSIYLNVRHVKMSKNQRLLLGDLELASSDLFDEIVWVLVVDGATNRVSSSQELTADTAQVLGHGSVLHDPSSTEHIIPSNVTIVADVLDLLSVPRWLLQGLDQQSTGTWHNRHGSLTVLNGKLDGHFQALVVLGVLANVVTNLFGRETERADLWGQRGGWGNLATDGSQAHSGDSSWVEFWRHF